MKCPYCNALAKLVTGADIYVRRPDLAGVHFWECKPCDAYVGTHKGSPSHVPLGRLANSELRAAKRRVHNSFDPLWKGGAMSRHEAYAWMALAMGMTKKEAHIGLFDMAQCKRLLVAIENRMENLK